jgi:transcriptional regulator with XRE-family HTH domain
VPFSPDQEQFLTALGARIRSLRTEADMTQERLAEQVGINTRTVQKIEAGKLNILVTTLARIQAALRCEWDDLMGSRRRRG